MSNVVFPVLPGLGWSVTKTPHWSTVIQKAVSGKELRAALMSYPLYRIALTYEVLRAGAAYAELQTLIGFFNNRQGAFDSFLYDDTSDNTVTAHSFGTGNGSTTAFQLVRALGGNTEPVMNLNSNPSIYVAGALKTPTTDYTLNNGMVTFAAAPANGAALTWTGGYYYRCRFLQDSADFENFLYQLWTLKKLELWGCLGTKI
jgi:uncharacterized protein (TIGR02217 family)